MENEIQKKMIYPKMRTIEKIAIFISYMLDNNKEFQVEPKAALKNEIDEKKIKSLRKTFRKMFNTSKNAGYDGQNYLKRIQKYGKFTGSCLAYAAYLYLKALKHTILAELPETCSLKLFASCLNISQKLIMDSSWIPQEFGILTGFKLKNLAKMERFLIFNIFKLKFSYNRKSLSKILKIVEINWEKIGNKIYLDKNTKDFEEESTSTVKKSVQDDEEVKISRRESNMSMSRKFLVPRRAATPGLKSSNNNVFRIHTIQTAYKKSLQVNLLNNNKSTIKKIIPF